MMLTAFAAMETIHVWAYSHLNDTLGLPEVEYKAFREYEAMKNCFRARLSSWPPKKLAKF